MDRDSIRHFQKGERIISEGETARSAYLILHGRVRVFMEKDGKETTLAELETGALFGENALFDRPVHEASVEALDDETKITLIHPSSFRGKIQNSDPMLRSIIHMLMDRQKRTNIALQESEARVTRLSAQDM